MRKFFKKSIIALLSVATFTTCGVATRLLNASAATAKATDIFTVSDGLTVDYNVSGSEKVSMLTKDARGIHFSTKQNGNAGEGNFVAFSNTLSGLFELDFRVYTQQKASIQYGGGDWYKGNDAEEIREVAITLTDTDENESFTVYIKGGSPWLESVPNARVAYGTVGQNYGTGMRYGVANGGQDYDDTTTPYNGGSLASVEYNTQMKGTSFTNNNLHSTYIGFDPITKEVYTYAFKSSLDESAYTAIFNRRVILDLDNQDHLAYAGTGASKLLQCSFRNYKVQFTVTDITGADEIGSQGKDEPANFIIYSLNGESLKGVDGVITQSTAAGLSADFSQTAMQNQAYTIPTPTLRSIYGETHAFKGKVQVLSPSGAEMLATTAWTDGLTFTPDTIGEYTVVYSSIRNPYSYNQRKAFSANGTFTGAEVTYAYPLQVEKANLSTGTVGALIDTNGLTATYDTAGSALHADLVRDSNKGVAFVSTGVGADAVGSSVAFKNTLTGLMELNFRAYSEVTDSASDYWDGGEWYTRNNAEEIREMAITVTDVETGESFTVYVKGGTAWNAISPNARVAYGDVGAYYGTGRWYQVNSGGLAYHGTGKGLSSTTYNTEIVGTTFTNRARNASGFIGSGYSTCIGFDPVTKIVYAYTYGATDATALEKRPILDLDDAEDMRYLMMNASGSNVNAGLPTAFVESTFQKYTVKMTVTEMTDDKSAKFVVYHVNGQSLGGADGKLYSNGGYGLYLPKSENAFLGLTTNFPTPYASSVLTGEKAFSGTIEIVNEDGQVVLAKQTYSPSVAFTPTAIGKYTAYYGGMEDENDFVRLAYGLGGYNGEEERLAYPFEVKENALVLPSYEYVMKGMKVEIGAQTLASNLKTYLTVEKDGNVYDGVKDLQIGNNYAYAFKDNGAYDLIYTVESAIGGKVSYSTSVQVVAMKGFINVAEAVLLLGVDSVWDKNCFDVFYCDAGKIDDYDIYVELYDGSAWVAVTSAPVKSVNLKDVLLDLGQGEWNVRFTLSKNGDSLLLEKTLTVKDGFAPVINVESLTDAFIATPAQDSDTAKYFVVLAGTESKLPVATAQDSVDGDVAVQVLLKTPTDDFANEVDADAVITFAVGEYILLYKAVDTAGNESSFCYFISAKETWFNVTAQSEKVELGCAVTIPKPQVVSGFTGESITDFEWTAVVFFNGERLEEIDGEYIPRFIGEYELVYTITYLGVSQDCTICVTVEDTQKPTIYVDGEYKTTAKVGDIIRVYDYEVDDNNACSVTVEVVCDGMVKVAVSEDNTFVIDKAGTYTITYSATDIAGNTTSVRYTITVTAPKTAKSGCSGSVSGAFAMSAMIAVIGCAILKRKEN